MSKQSRKWYKKKRYIIPLIFFGIMLLIGILTPTTETSVATNKKTVNEGSTNSDKEKKVSSEEEKDAEAKEKQKEEYLKIRENIIKTDKTFSTYTTAYTKALESGDAFKSYDLAGQTMEVAEKARKISRFDIDKKLFGKDITSQLTDLRGTLIDRYTSYRMAMKYARNYLDNQKMSDLEESNTWLDNSNAYYTEAVVSLATLDNYFEIEEETEEETESEN